MMKPWVYDFRKHYPSVLAAFTKLSNKLKKKHQKDFFQGVEYEIEAVDFQGDSLEKIIFTVRSKLTPEKTMQINLEEFCHPGTEAHHQINSLIDEAEKHLLNLLYFHIETKKAKQEKRSLRILDPHTDIMDLYERGKKSHEVDHSYLSFLDVIVRKEKEVQE